MAYVSENVPLMSAGAYRELEGMHDRRGLAIRIGLASVSALSRRLSAHALWVDDSQESEGATTC